MPFKPFIADYVVSLLPTPSTRYSAVSHGEVRRPSHDYYPGTTLAISRTSSQIIMILGIPAPFPPRDLGTYK
eukprot:3934401-Rhodomonas_salina.2